MSRRTKLYALTAIVIAVIIGALTLATDMFSYLCSSDSPMNWFYFATSWGCIPILFSGITIVASVVIVWVISLFISSDNKEGETNNGISIGGIRGWFNTYTIYQQFPETETRQRTELPERKRTLQDFLGDLNERVSIYLHFLKDEKPKLLASEGHNRLFTYQGSRIAVALMPVKNQPGRRTDKSIAYDVSAKIEYFTKDDKLILRVKCGYLSKVTAEDYFQEMGDKKGCTKVVFFADESYSIPLLYEVEGDNVTYAYDHGSPFKARKLGNLPIKINIWLSGANYKSKYPIKFFVVPNTTATKPKGFWLQKR